MSSFFLTNSFENFVNNLNSFIQIRRPVLIEGPIGCGKTSLVEYAANQNQRELLRVQISDQNDAKSLIGNYCCTPVPGQFIWRPGPLLIALERGHWLLLEDVDRAQSELHTLLLPLLEGYHYHNTPILLPGVPGDRPSAPIHENFALIATRRLTYNLDYGLQAVSVNHFDLERKWNRIVMRGIPREECSLIIEQIFPNLHDLIGRLVELYELLIDNSSSSKMHKPSTHLRQLSMRDLLKFASRLSVQCVTPHQVKDINTETAFIDAFECFVAAQVDPIERLTMLEKVAALFNFTKSQALQIMHDRVPSITVSEYTFQIGRIALSRSKNNVNNNSNKSSAKIRLAETTQSVCLLEFLACCVANEESCLLVGETGCGKTACVQYLAQATGHRLRVINMNQQSDCADLIGGYKPIELKYLVRPVREDFEVLFNRTFNKSGQNDTFTNHLQTCFVNRRWQDLIALMKHPIKIALDKFKQDKSDDLFCDWLSMSERVDVLSNQIVAGESALAFSFMEGSLVEALRQGDWVLLDEINLAAPEMLDSLAGLLESSKGSVLIAERGDTNHVKRHPDFHLFACMNPATDVGKRDLPIGIRNRFTEIFVSEPDLSTTGPHLDKAEKDFFILVSHYLRGMATTSEQKRAVVEFYRHVKIASKESLEDGCKQRPNFSLRTLCRALMETSRNTHGGTARSLYEGFCFSFLSQLSRNSRPVVERLIVKHLLQGKPPGKSPLPPPNSKEDFICVEGYWLHTGSLKAKVSDEETYIITDSVRNNLRDLARVVSGGSLPVLLQGETSIGKTSLIHYLASLVGQVCLRVNNHEHTDLQEYVGAYTTVTDSSSSEDDPPNRSGRLVFKEGVLVEAMRKGYWIILDELNLAPTDILEALNRVLDDNRELFIPETQEVVRAHPRFMLFATQNPPGLYGGRKVLSRALRNRFIELHFDPIPNKELEVILEKKCSLPASRSKKLVEVLHSLQMIRKESGVFQGKEGFITLRDLFRWAERYRLAEASLSSEVRFFDWDQYLADQGYLLVAGRVRRVAEANTVKQVLEKVFRRKVEESNLFDLSDNTSPATKDILQSVIENPLTSCDEFKHLVWTREMRRLAVMVTTALKYNEPVLLIGETGCGKTTVCQLLARLASRSLLSINCHMHTEAADFLGGLRPVRGQHLEQETDPSEVKLFEWVDGPLVVAMTTGAYLLIDEISLADDSVLERLNSVLEPERRLLLAEKVSGAISDDISAQTIVANSEFRLVSTMNPGADFGKKELSPALRNRFTEIWCPVTSDSTDLERIVEHNLLPQLEQNSINKQLMAHAMVEFISWYQEHDPRKKVVPTIRDLLSWVNFINATCSTPDNHFHPSMAFIHGAFLVFIDMFSADETDSSHCNSSRFKHEAATFLADCIHRFCSDCLTEDLQIIQDVMLKPVSCLNHSDILQHTTLQLTEEKFGISPFYIDRGVSPVASLPENYSLIAPSPARNCWRLLRALQLPKPILLEGSPGVGKTSLVQAIAEASGWPLVRINLSDQTDVGDLFGCDLPVEGGKGGEFAWRDGPLLSALKQGHWILLDEMNLASQSVLESLNACLDHRGEIFIPELNLTFEIKPGVTRLFACQNPFKEGGARKGLPRSFLNRFTQVYLDALSSDDQLMILKTKYSSLPESLIQMMVNFNQELNEAVMVRREFGQRGSPWEFNLRDLSRWCRLLVTQQSPTCYNPGEYLGLIYVDRMRSEEDKIKVCELWRRILEEHQSLSLYPIYHPGMSCHISENHFILGHSQLQCVATESEDISDEPGERRPDSLHLLHSSLGVIESIMKCVQLGWMTLLVGPASSGKSSVVSLLSHVTGHNLEVVSLHSGMDTTELLGSFEQSSEGGKFVWVESRLVTAMRLGHWILLDNANFCNPSVLDRLNGLLEPDGVLTITERGLIDGELPTVTPHPNFRIFLALNPDSGVANRSGAGEISRAMRNRGIEIAFTHSQIWSLPLSAPDLRYLLRACGLTASQAACLLEFYHRVDQCRLEQWNIRCPSINSLFTTSRLWSGMTTERKDQEELSPNVVRQLFTELFVSSQFAESAKSKLMHELDLFLHSDWSSSTSSSIGSSSDCRLIQPCSLLSVEPDLCRVKQEWCYLQHIFTSQIDLSTPDSLHTMARLFCERATDKDVRIRRAILNDWQPSSPSAQLFVQFASGLLNCLIKGKKKNLLLDSTLKLDECPYDLRWLALSNVGVCTAENMSQWNWLFVKFYHCLLEYKINQMIESTPKRIKRESLGKLSPLELCKLTESNKIPDSWVENYTEILNVPALIHLIVDYLSTKKVHSSDRILQHSEVLKLVNELMECVDFATSAVSDEASSWRGVAILHLNRVKEKLLDEGYLRVKPLSKHIGSMLRTLQKNIVTIRGIKGVSSKQLRRIFPITKPWTCESQVHLRMELSDMLQFGSLWRERVRDTLERQLLRLLTPRFAQTLASGFELVSNCLVDLDKSEERREIEMKIKIMKTELFSSVDTNSIQSLNVVESHLWPVKLLLVHKVSNILPSLFSSERRAVTALIMKQFLDFLSSGHLPDVYQLLADTHSLCTRIDHHESDLISPSLLAWLVERDLWLYSATQRELLLALSQSCTVLNREDGTIAVKLPWKEGSSKNESRSSVTSLSDVIFFFISSLNGKEFIFKADCDMKNRQDEDSPLSTEYTLINYQTKLRQLHELNKLVSHVAPVITSAQFQPLAGERHLFEHLATIQLKAFILSLDNHEMKIKIPRHELNQCSLQELIQFSQQTSLDKIIQSKLPALGAQIQLVTDNQPIKSMPLSVLSNCWILWGCAQMQLFALSDSLDPKEVLKMRLKSAESELHRLEKELDIRSTLSVLSCGVQLTEETASGQHPHLPALMSRIRVLREKTEKLRSELAYRPIRERFSHIRSLMAHFLNNYGVSHLLDSEATRVSPDLTGSAINRDRWCNAAVTLLHSLSTDRTAYEDVLSPFTIGVTRVMKGLQMLGESMPMKNKKMSSVNDLVRLLSSFPHSLTPECCSSLMSAAQELCSEHTVHQIRVALSHTSSTTQRKATLRLWQLGLRFLLLSGKGPSSDANIGSSLLNDLMRQLSDTWHAEAAQREEREEIKNQLVIEKSKRLELLQSKNKESGVVEEEENYIPTRNFEEEYDMPLSRDVLGANVDRDNLYSEFAQLEISALSNIQLSLTEDDIHFLVVVLQRYLFDLNNSESSGKTVMEEDILKVMSDSYRLAASIATSAGVPLDSSIDTDLMMSHLTLTSFLSGHYSHLNDSAIGSIDAARPLDIYNDSNPPEVLRTRDALQSVKVKIEQLVREFPEHPTLLRILILVNRIENNPVSEPLMKFVTGLELLLRELQSWEKDASRAVSVQVEMDEVIQVLVSWRKLELNCWLSTLDTCIWTVKRRVSQLLFHLYDLLLINKSPAQTEQQLKKDQDTVEALCTFMESCSIGEFEPRLDLMRTFHLFMKSQYKEKSDTKYLLVSNVVTYYSQFLPSVRETISELRKPIEKEMKEFVRVMRWGDYSFWSVKASVEKCHKTIARCKRKWISALDQPLSSGLNLQSSPDTVNTFPLSPWRAPFEAPVVKKVLLSKLESMDAIELPDLVRRLPGLTSRFIKFTHNFTEQLHLSDWSVKLDEFTSDWLETVEQFQTALNNLPPQDTPEMKKKWKTQVTQIQQRKRKALSDYFKELSSMGLSYRAGLINPCDHIYQLLESSSVLLEDSLKSLSDDNGSSSLNVRRLLLRCVAKRALLSSARTKPSQELGVDNIDRCIGFVDHLFAKCLHLYKRMFQEFCPRLAQLKSTIEALDVTVNHFPKICPGDAASYRRSASILKEQTVDCIEQWTMIWRQESITDDHTEHIISPWPSVMVPQVLKNPSTVLKQNGEIFQTIKEDLSQIQFTNSLLLTSHESEVSSHLSKSITSLSQLVQSIRNQYSISEEHNFHNESEITRPMETICNHLLSSVTGLSKYLQPIGDVSMFTDKNKTHYLGLVNDLVQSLLLNMQTLMSLCDDSPTQQEHEESIDTDDLIDKKLYRTTRALLSLTESKSIAETVCQLTNQICQSQCNPAVLELYFNLIGCLTPLLRVHVCLYDWILSRAITGQHSLLRLLSGMTSVFTNLMQNGFCLPAEMEQVAGEGEKGENFKDIESGGLGEGEGAKDVSEQIESEDQLDDAFKKGEEQNKNEKDEKLEDQEHGIEMSDDFEGALHDAEQKESDDEKEDDPERDAREDETLDDQMGEVDDNLGRELDQEMWGQDEEEEEQNQNDKREEEDAKGVAEKQSKETVAKEDNTGCQDAEDLDADMAEYEEEEGQENEMEVDERDRQEPEDKEEEELDIDFKEDPVEVSETTEKEGPEDIEEEEEKKEENLEIPNEEMDVDTAEDKEESGGGDKEGQEEENDKDDTDGQADDVEPEDSQEENVSPEEKGENNILPDLLPAPMDTEDLQQSSDNNRKNDDKSGESTYQGAGSKANDQQQPDTMPQSSGETAAPDAMPDDNLEEGSSLGPEQSGSNDQAMTSSNAQSTSSNDNSQRSRPDRASDKRQLGDINQDVKNDREVLEASEVPRKKPRRDPGDPESNDLFEHIEEEEEEGGVQVMDSATEEQQSKQLLQTKEQVQEDKEQAAAGNQKRNQIDNFQTVEEENEQPIPSKKSNDDKDNEESGSDRVEKKPSSGEVVVTLTVGRGPTSTFHTQMLPSEPSDVDLTSQLNLLFSPDFTQQEIPQPSKERFQAAQSIWANCQSHTESLSRDLCDQLRLILDPMEARRLKGDYRSGRRLNMRKVIPFIASQFRKDKIWLRRTKPSHRNYQILIAVDDSSSMQDNFCQQMTFEALSIVSNALTMLESGQLGVCSFGESLRLLHPLSEPFTSEAGAKVISNFEFVQKKTNLINVLCDSLRLMEQTPISSQSSSNLPAQLLLIISDGVFSEDPLSPKLQSLVRSATEKGLFIVCLILDNPKKKHSVFDMKKYLGPGNFVNYMDLFPLPFYLVLRDIQSLPAILADALRQWFELISAQAGK